MAANNIGLRITLNGVDTVVRSITELENAIKSAKEQLTGEQLGSAQFKKLTGEISKAEGKLKDLQKRAEGISLEKRIGDFTKFGAAITASFAGAVAAVNLFGADTEKVSKAAAAAQNVLTIALAARSAAEGFAAAGTVVLTVETYALAAAEYVATTATGVLATALETLFAVIAANPIGAILVAIGLLIAGVVYLTSSTDDAREAEEAYQRTLQRGKSIREDQLKLLQAQGAAEDVIAQKRLQNAQADALDAQRELSRAIAQKKSIKEIEDLRTKASQASRNVEIERASLQTTIRNKEKRELEAARQAEKERLAEREKLIKDNARVALEAIATEKKAFEDLLKTLEKEIPEPLVVTQLKSVIEVSKQLGQVGIQKSFQGILDDFYALPPAVEKSTGELDKFGKMMIEGLPNIRFVTSNILGRTVKDFGDFRDKLSRALRADEISREAYEAGIEIANAYQKIFEVINDPKQPELKDIDITGLRKATENLEAAGGEFIYTFQEIEGELVAIQLKTDDDLTVAQNKYNTRVLAETMKVKRYLLKNSEEIQAIREQDAIDGTNLAEETAQAQAEAAIKGLVEKQKQIILKEDEISAFYIEIGKLRLEREQLQNKALLGIVSQNVDLIIAEGQKLYDIDSAAFEEYIQDKISGLIDYTKLDAEGLQQLEALYAEFYKKVKEQRDKNSADEKADFDKRVQKVEQNIRDIQAAITSVSQTLADFYALQLDNLDKQQEALQAKILGDTKEANEKRIELDKIYQKERSDLEKKALKTSLRLTLLQAIADAAAAVVTIFKQTGILGGAAATAIAISSAAQIAIITAQLNSIDKYRRGGKLMKYAGGGMVVGPSHEMGGVKYQGGGIELEGNEAVINRVSSIRYAGLLSEINQSGGGKPLVVNNFDDSRIVEAIAKQKREPIRAYVLEQEITNKQAVSRRLEQLSQI